MFREGPAPAPSQAPVLGSKLFITTDTGDGGPMPLLQDRLEQIDSAVKTYKQVLAITKMNQGNNKDRHN